MVKKRVEISTGAGEDFQKRQLDTVETLNCRYIVDLLQKMLTTQSRTAGIVLANLKVGMQE